MFVLSYITQLYCLMIRYLQKRKEEGRKKLNISIWQDYDGTNITTVNYITLQMYDAF